MNSNKREYLPVTTSLQSLSYKYTTKDVFTPYAYNFVFLHAINIILNNTGGKGIMDHIVSCPKKNMRGLVHGGKKNKYNASEYYRIGEMSVFFFHSKYGSNLAFDVCEIISRAYS